MKFVVLELGFKILRIALTLSYKVVKKLDKASSRIKRFSRHSETSNTLICSRYLKSINLRRGQFHPPLWSQLQSLLLIY